MAHEDLQNRVMAAIREEAAKQPDLNVEQLLQRVEALFAQDNDFSRDANVPDLAGIPLGGELDDYDHERPDSEDDGVEAEDMIAGTITEVGARTASPFGGSVAHAGEERFGGPRPASLGPVGGPVEERGYRTFDEENLGDPTDLGDQLFANRSVDREDPRHDPEDVGET